MAATTAESLFTMSDGLKVYTQTWKTTLEKPLAYAFFLHGFSDHCNAYYSFFPNLAARGIEVFSFDQRGWGRTCATKAQRGLTGPNSQILQDIDELLIPRLTLAESQNVPTFLMGHSNGGGIALWYAIYGTHRDRFAGVVAQSPLIALHPHIKPWFTTVAAGKIAAKFFPNQQLLNKLDPKVMSRDKEVCRNFDEDELCHDTGTLTQLADMLGRGKSLQKEEVYAKYNPDIPLLVAHGSGDMCTSYDASKEFVEKANIKDKTFKSYDGWYHKLHAEPGNDRLQFANDIADWILQRASTAPGPSTSAVGAKL
ncbi:alpha/beta-hydrolase [Terfezia boudieri ATCC MYA-4762]|uniref:Alpha/beta-hydrolase n=1 Tax=Terfezia boudieri ATCC MYA-4762 TaxID=1051890 RepID=A0A3N4MFG3_9PEZI|nr:alpha/beta-hydrolase [Terfezia boudieri ATCC MYA-4762]